MNTLELFKEVRVFVFDVDGVMTDGQLLITEEGHLLRSMNIKDGYAIQWAVKQGYHVWAISGARSEGVRTRLQKLGIEEVHIDIKDKVPVLKSLLQKHGISKEHLLYMGDDFPDLECMQFAGFPTCPADAVPEIIALSRYISPFGGGKGCVRDVIRKTMLLHDKWT